MSYNEDQFRIIFKVVSERLNLNYKKLNISTSGMVNGYVDATEVDIPPVIGSVYRAKEDVKENVFLGILGAIIGSIFGICLIFVLGHFGFIAGIGGAALGAYPTIKKNYYEELDNIDYSNRPAA